MSLTDWDIFTNGNYVVTTESGTPIEGVQSLLIDNASGAGGNGAGVVTPSASDLTRGLTAGRMRTIMRKTAGPTSPAAATAGIYFLSSQINPLSSTIAYSVAHIDNGDIAINYHTTTLQNISIVLATASSLISDITTNFTLEVMWFHDAVNFGGTRIEVKTGLALDYSDLPAVPDLALTETTFGLSNTNGEGIFCGNNGGSEQDWIFDKTQLYSVNFN
jgi:hypothetical protein